MADEKNKVWRWFAALVGGLIMVLSVVGLFLMVLEEFFEVVKIIILGGIGITIVLFLSLTIISILQKIKARIEEHLRFRYGFERYSKGTKVLQTILGLFVVVMGGLIVVAQVAAVLYLFGRALWKFDITDTIRFGFFSLVVIFILWIMISESGVLQKIKERIKHFYS